MCKILTQGFLPQLMVKINVEGGNPTFLEIKGQELLLKKL